MAFIQQEINERARIDSSSNFKPASYYQKQNGVIETSLEKLALAEKSKPEISFNDGLKSYIEAQIIIATLDGNSTLLLALRKQLERLVEINSLAQQYDLGQVIEKTSFERMTLKLTDNPEAIFSNLTDLAKNFVNL